MVNCCVKIVTIVRDVGTFRSPGRSVSGYDSDARESTSYTRRQVVNNSLDFIVDNWRFCFKKQNKQEKNGKKNVS